MMSWFCISAAFWCWAVRDNAGAKPGKMSPQALQNAVLEFIESRFARTHHRLRRLPTDRFLIDHPSPTKRHKQTDASGHTHCFLIMMQGFFNDDCSIGPRRTWEKDL